uniref:Uncharacterized protein n=1 Tax=Arundo donax TaxID=35708 RepID=A0A0A9E251_ARUDO
MRAVMYGTVEGSAGSWYEAVASTPFSDGANLELLSLFQVRLSASRPIGVEDPQSRRIWPEPVELLSAATVNDKRNSSVKHLRVNSKARCIIVVVAVSR